MQSRLQPRCLASESSVTSSIFFPFPSADNTTSVAKPIPPCFVYNSCFHPGIKNELPPNSKNQKPKEQAQGRGNHSPDSKGTDIPGSWGQGLRVASAFPGSLLET